MTLLNRIGCEKNIMNSDNSQKSNKIQLGSYNWAILIVSAAYYVIAFRWQQLFVRGSIGGIYWLFIHTEKLSLPLSTAIFGLAFILLLIATISRITKRGNYSGIAKNAVIFSYRVY